MLHDAFEGETCPYSFFIFLSTECIKCINVISIVQNAYLNRNYSSTNIDSAPLFISINTISLLW